MEIDCSLMVDCVYELLQTSCIRLRMLGERPEQVFPGRAQFLVIHHGSTEVCEVLVLFSVSVMDEEAKVLADVLIHDHISCPLEAKLHACSVSEVKPETMRYRIVRMDHSRSCAAGQLERETVSLFTLLLPHAETPQCKPAYVTYLQPSISM